MSRWRHCLRCRQSAEPVKVSVADSPNTGAASAKVSSWNTPRRNLTGRSGARSPPAFLAGAGAAGLIAAAGAGMGRRSMSTRPITTRSISTRNEASGRRDQSISTWSIFSQTPSLSASEMSRNIGCADSGPSIAPMSSFIFSDDAARETKSANMLLPDCVFAFSPIAASAKMSKTNPTPTPMYRHTRPRIKTTPQCR